MPSWMVYSVLFASGMSLPLEGIWYQEIGPFILTPNKLAAAVLLLLVSLQTILAPRFPPFTAKHMWMFALFGAVGIGSLQAVSEGTSIFEILSRWQNFAALLLFFLLLPVVVVDRRGLHVLFWSLIAGGVVAAASGALGVGVAGVPYGYERTAGLGGAVNQTAGNLLLILPLGYALFVQSRSILTKLVLLGMTGLLGFGVLLSFSRSGFLAALAMGLLFMVRFGRSGQVQRVIPLAVLFGALLLVAPARYFDRIGGMLDSSKESRTDHRSNLAREMQYYQGARAFLYHPVIGVGIERFSNWAHSEDPKFPETMALHNATLQVAAELGMAGLVPFLMVLYLTWTEFSRVARRPRAAALRKDRELEALRLYAICGQIGFLGHLIVCQFQPMAWKKGIYLAFALSTILYGLARQRIARLEHAAARLPQPAPPGETGTFAPFPTPQPR